MMYDQMDELQRANVDNELSGRYQVLGSIIHNWAVSLAKLIMAANAGALVATFAYRGTLGGNAPWNINCALYSFALGFLAITGVAIWMYIRARSVLAQYISDVSRFRESHLSLEQVRLNDAKRVENDTKEYVGATIALGLFVIGVILALMR